MGPPSLDVQRRTLLQTSAAALCTALAGCASGLASPNDQPSGTEQTPDGDETTTDTDASMRHASVRVIIENRTDAVKSGTVSVSHTMTPACRYATPECQRPSTQNTPLEKSFTVDAESETEFGPVSVGIEAEGDTVDSYTATVRADEQTETVTGVEPGAAAIIGRDKAGDYPWRVAAREYIINAVITTDSGVRVSVRTPHTNKTVPGNPCTVDPENCETQNTTSGDISRTTGTGTTNTTETS